LLLWAANAGVAMLAATIAEAKTSFEMFAMIFSPRERPLAASLR